SVQFSVWRFRMPGPAVLRRAVCGVSGVRGHVCGGPLGRQQCGCSPWIVSEQDTASPRCFSRIPRSWIAYSPSASTPRRTAPSRGRLLFSCGSSTNAEVTVKALALTILVVLWLPVAAATETIQGRWTLVAAEDLRADAPI